jgi:hypothetical protein
MTDRSTWGHDGNRLVYLVKFNIPYPADKLCPKCWTEVKLDKGDEWDVHMMTHRLWFYEDTGERYLNGISQHRHCPCPDNQPKPMFPCWQCGGYFCSLHNKPIPAPPMWCSECGGYIRIIP